MTSLLALPQILKPLVSGKFLKTIFKLQGSLEKLQEKKKKSIKVIRQLWFKIRKCPFTRFSMTVIDFL